MKTLLVITFLIKLLALTDIFYIYIHDLDIKSNQSVSHNAINFKNT